MRCGSFSCRPYRQSSSWADRCGRELAPSHRRHRRSQDCRNASRSALIVSAWVVGIPWGNHAYVLSVPFCTSSADNGPESAYGTIWSSSPCMTSAPIHKSLAIWRRLDAPESIRPNAGTTSTCCWNGRPQPRPATRPIIKGLVNHCTRTGTVIFLRSSVKSVWEKATKPGLASVFTISGGTELMSTAFATRLSPCRAM